MPGGNEQSSEHVGQQTSGEIPEVDESNERQPEAQARIEPDHSDIGTTRMMTALASQPTSSSEPSSSSAMRRSGPNQNNPQTYHYNNSDDTQQRSRFVEVNEQNVRQVRENQRQTAPHLWSSQVLLQAVQDAIGLVDSKEPEAGDNIPHHQGRNHDPSRRLLSSSSSPSPSSTPMLQSVDLAGSNERRRRTIDGDTSGLARQENPGNESQGTIRRTNEEAHMHHRRMLLHAIQVAEDSIAATEPTRGEEGDSHDRKK